MSDKVRTLTVILDHDHTDEWADQIIQAIRMTRGVLDVKPGESVTGRDETNRLLARLEIAGTLRELASALHGHDGRWEQVQELLAK